MSTWLALIVETNGRPDFWEVAAKHHIGPAASGVPARALIECPWVANADLPLVLAEALSRELGSTALGFAAQTTADVYRLHAFTRGARVRKLDYSRDEGGWLAIEGTPQPWEPAFFFDPGGSTTDDGAAWPDMLDDELTDEKIAAYESARAKGDPGPVMRHLSPSSTMPLIRICEWYGLAGDAPHGRVGKPRSIFARLFGRG
ncbi:MAG: hypothetical protein ACK4N5_26185 [Myxococcales bacterium]